MNPTDAQITERLARFLGCDNFYFNGRDYYAVFPEDQPGGCRSSLPKFTESLDALRPVLEKLSEEQWWQLFQVLDRIYCKDDSFAATGSERLRHILTLPSRTLALALYEVIGE